MRSSAVYLGHNTVLIKTRYDDKMFVDSRDLGIAPHLILDGNWEEWITIVLGGFLTPDVVFFDVGANFGWFTLFAATRVKQVHAFEPNANLFRLLERSVHVNGKSNVKLAQQALGDVVEQRQLDVSDNWVGNGRIVELEERMFHHQDVTVNTLDNYTDSSEGRLLGDEAVVLKIDVEGFEPRVVLGGKNLVSRPNCTAFVEYHPDASKLVEMLDLFESLHYRMAHVKESAELEDINREQLANLRPADMLCFYKWQL